MNKNHYFKLFINICFLIILWINQYIETLCFSLGHLWNETINFKIEFSNSWQHFYIKKVNINYKFHKKSHFI